MKFNHILVSGCSMVSGCSLPLGKEDPTLWTNIVANNLNAKLTNVSVTAGSNQLIFEEALTGLATISGIDLLIVAWTVFPRFRFYPGVPEFKVGPKIIIDDFSFGVTSGTPPREIKWRGGNISLADSETLKRILLSIDEDRHNFTQIIRYNTILSHVAKLMNIPVVFVNAAIPDRPVDFFVRKDIKSMVDGPIMLDELTKKLIQIDKIDDNSIIEIYNNIHNEFERMGNICLTEWANFDTSLYSLGVDKAIDNNHLGPKSNAIYAEIILTYLKEIQCQI